MGRLASLVLLLVGCSATHRVVLDVRTDLVPGQEFDAIEVTFDDGPVQHTPAAERDAYARSPVRIAETSLPSGEHSIVVRAMHRGELQIERRIVAHIRHSEVITVVLGRSCRGVVCGDPVRQTCIAGICADPRCYEGGPYCGQLGACTRDGDCTAGPACAAGICADGECLIATDDQGCAVGEWCHAELGCRAMESVPCACDAGADAGSDAGVDAAIDASAGELDGGTGPTCDLGCVSMDSADSSGAVFCRGNFATVPATPSGYASYEITSGTSCSSRIDMPPVAPGESLYAAFNARFAADRRSATNVFMLFGEGDQIMLGLYGPNESHPEIYVQGGARGWQPASFETAHEQWVCVQLHVRHAIDGRVRVWWDGAPAIDLVADTTIASGAYDTVYIGGAFGDGLSGRVDIDEVRLARAPVGCAAPPQTL